MNLLPQPYGTKYEYGIDIHNQRIWVLYYDFVAIFLFIFFPKIQMAQFFFIRSENYFSIITFPKFMNDVYSFTNILHTGTPFYG